MAEGKLTKCRNPLCGIMFDPKWRVRHEDEPPEAEFLCPRCGMDLRLNPNIRRAGDENLAQQEVT